MSRALHYQCLPALAEPGARRRLDNEHRCVAAASVGAGAGAAGTSTVAAAAAAAGVGSAAAIVASGSVEEALCKIHGAADLYDAILWIHQKWRV